MDDGRRRAGVELRRVDRVVNENLREVQPTIFFAVPRIWEKLHAVALIKASDATWFKRKVLNFGLNLGRRIGRIKVAHGGDHTVSSASCTPSAG